MKKTTRFAFLSMLLIAVMLVLSMGSAMAEDLPQTYIDKPAKFADNKIYGYQIFTCIRNDTTNMLENVEWGDGIDPDKFLMELADQDHSEFKTGMTAQDTATAIANLIAADGSDRAAQDKHGEHIRKAALASYIDAKGIEIKSSKVDYLARGYYLIVDKTLEKLEATMSPAEYENLTLVYELNKALLTYTDNHTFQIKTAKPEVEKKVQENTKYKDGNGMKDDGYGPGFNDVADYNIGDDVTFRLYATIPDMEHYETYQMIFHDKLSAGLTPKAGSLNVYLCADKANPTAGTKLGTGDYSLNKDDQSDIQIAIEDLKALKKKVVNAGGTANYVVVEYKATVNSNAVIGLDGNPNTVRLAFSNNPDQSGKGSPVKGQTPPDEVIVFTYELDVNKVDSNDGKLLENAEFKLFKKETAGNTTINYAIVTPKTATIEVEEEEKTYTAYVIEGWTTDADAASTLTSNPYAPIKVIGLDHNELYYLEETKAPDKYIGLKAPINVSITANTANGQNWTTFNPAAALTDIQIKYDLIANAENGNVNTGIVSAEIENRLATELPETGSVGTTIFTFGGLAMMMAAAIVFALRRREEEA